MKMSAVVVLVVAVLGGGAVWCDADQPGPLSKAEIESLVEGGVTSESMVRIIDLRCISFELTPDLLIQYSKRLDKSVLTAMVSCGEAEAPGELPDHPPTAPAQPSPPEQDFSVAQVNVSESLVKQSDRTHGAFIGLEPVQGHTGSYRPAKSDDFTWVFSCGGEVDYPGGLRRCKPVIGEGAPILPGQYLLFLCGEKTSRRTIYRIKERAVYCASFRVIRDSDTDPEVSFDWAKYSSDIRFDVTSGFSVLKRGKWMHTEIDQPLVTSGGAPNEAGVREALRELNTSRYYQ